jgi:hypothetical protein
MTQLHGLLSGRAGHASPLRASLVVAAALALPSVASASWTDSPLPLPAPTGRVVTVSTEAQLQAAVASLISGTTVMIAPGTYRLTRTLAIHGPLADITIRGATDRRGDVVIEGAGRDNAAVPHGIWAGGDVRRLTIANLTIREVYYHCIILNPGPQQPRIYNVHLMNAGEQLVKTNPNADGTGIDEGVIEHSLFEYTPFSRNYYANAIQVLAGRNWVIRDNLIRNIRAPEGEMAGPAVLAWYSASGTTVEANTFVNCQRAISFGLIQRTPDDHSGGTIRNNFIYRDAGIAGADVSIGVFDSPGTQVVHNTILTLDGYPNAIEYRFPGTTGVTIANNLLNRAVTAREGASATLEGNVGAADAAMFVNAAQGDLHLAAGATAAIDRAKVREGASVDWDGGPRPVGPAADAGADEFGAVPPAPPTKVVVGR